MPPLPGTDGAEKRRDIAVPINEILCIGIHLVTGQNRFQELQQTKRIRALCSSVQDPTQCLTITDTTAGGDAMNVLNLHV